MSPSLYNLWVHLSQGWTVCWVFSLFFIIVFITLYIFLRSPLHLQSLIQIRFLQRDQLYRIHQSNFLPPLWSIWVLETEGRGCGGVQQTWAASSVHHCRNALEKYLWRDDSVAGRWHGRLLGQEAKSRQALNGRKQTHDGNKPLFTFVWFHPCPHKKRLPLATTELGILTLRVLSLLTVKWHLCKRKKKSLSPLSKNPGSLDLNYLRLESLWRRKVGTVRQRDCVWELSHHKLLTPGCRINFWTWVGQVQHEYFTFLFPRGSVCRSIQIMKDKVNAGSFLFMPGWLTSFCLETLKCPLWRDDGCER